MLETAHKMGYNDTVAAKKAVMGFDSLSKVQQPHRFVTLRLFYVPCCTGSIAPFMVGCVGGRKPRRSFDGLSTHTRLPPSIDSEGSRLQICFKGVKHD